MSSESEASEELEENFSISVNPGWEYWEETNCRVVTGENGTYEECDWVTSYKNKLPETNITDPHWNDWIISAPLDSEFTFTLNGTNFSSTATYNFSYKIFTYGGYSGERHNMVYSDWVVEDIEITSASLIFIGNNSDIFSYNLSGNLSSNLLINETRGQYLGDCVQLYAIVTLEKKNNSIVDWTKSHTSNVFFPGQPYPNHRYPSGCSPPPQYPDWGTGGEYFLLIGIFMVFTLTSIYSQAKLTSWHFTGSYSSTPTQYLAILVSAILFIFLAMFPVAFCLAATVLFAQFVAYYTGHYDNSEVPEQDQPKPK